MSGTPTLAPQLGALTLPTQGQSKQEDLGFAAGGLYDAYKKAQQDQVDQQNQLVKSSRDRLSQIWELGLRNPQIQQNPQVHQQIDALYRQMGLPSPKGTDGSFDWNSLQPTKQFTDLKSDMLQQLRQMEPAQRKAFVRSSGIVGADDSFLNAPAEWTQVRLSAMNAQLQKLLTNKNTTVDGLREFVELNRNGLEQQHPGYTDSLLNDPHLYEQMAEATRDKLQKLQNDLGLQGDKKRLIQAQIDGIHDMDSLREVQTKFLKTKNEAYPKLVEAQIADLNANAAKNNEQINVFKANIDKVRAGLAVPPMTADALKLKSNAQNEYNKAVATYNNAQQNGGADDRVLDGLSAAKANLDEANAVWTTVQSKDFAAQVAANRATATSGSTVKPTDSNQAANGAKQVGTASGGPRQGQTVYQWADGSYHYADGTAYKKTW